MWCNHHQINLPSSCVVPGFFNGCHIVIYTMLYNHLTLIYVLLIYIWRFYNCNLHIVFFVILIQTVLLLLPVSNRDSLYSTFFILTCCILSSYFCIVVILTYVAFVLTYFYLVVHVSKGYLAFGWTTGLLRKHLGISKPNLYTLH